MALGQGRRDSIDEDIITVAVTSNTVTVTLRASRSAVFGQLLGNDTIVVRGTGQATATFGSPP
jgi:hypothetical protein